MRDWMRFGRLSVVVLGLGLTTSGCGSKDGGGTTSASSTPATTAPAAKTSAKPAESAKPTADKTPEKKVDIDAILKSAESTGKKGALKVDLSKLDDKDAPSLGGGKDTADTPPGEKDPEPAPGKKLEWLPAGSVEIPNPGWTKKSEGDKGMLTSPDAKIFLFFSKFKDQAEGQAIIDGMKGSLPLTDLEWSDPQVVKLGADEFPTLIGTATGKGEDGKGFELVYALIETGVEGQNLIVIGGAHEEASAAEKDDAEQILLGIRKPKGGN